MMISCYRGHNRIVEYLLSKKARVNRRSAKGNTALHDCAESGNLRSLQLLLEHRAIMRKDEYGQSPIMSGANAAYKKVVEYLAALSDSLPCQASDSLAISVHEKIAAYELLGASLFDRHSLVQDAITAWFQALKLRQEVGLDPKCLIPPIPSCPCHSAGSSLPTLPIERIDTNISNNNNNSNSRDASNVNANSWPFVSLAAREALALTEALRDPNRYRFTTRTDTLCTTCSEAVHTDPVEFESEKDMHISGDASVVSNDLYTRKTSSLRSELYFAYRLELQRVMAQSSQTQTLSSEPGSSRTACSSCFMSNSNASADHQNHSVPSSVSTHSPLAPIQVSTPADPLLGEEPLCWEAPRCRRWSLDRTLTCPTVSTHPLSSGLHRTKDCSRPFMRPNRCQHCGQFTVRLGHGIRRQIRGLCTPCILKSEVQGKFGNAFLKLIYSSGVC
ncbi:unnamed protein product [Echinostoma caproni]|uniref:Uncharacterized protein n=1 Tax=Echinostoma caproni TaxID=27848 RepID=A0A3P8LDN1_9TREM|nr:unnamed protein product [Echinostoma caproni]